MSEGTNSLQSTGILVLIGAFLCAVLLTPGIILINNQSAHHIKTMGAIQSIKDEMARDKIDGLLKESMTVRLEAIDNE
jgi:hypothetical protein